MHLFLRRVVFALLCAGPVFAADTDALRAELEAMHETDQAQRQQMTAVEKQHGPNSSEMKELWRQQSESDAHNIRRLEEIITAIGWPRRSVVGQKAATAAFLILQHADISFQKKYVARCREAVAAGEMNPSSLALLEDRILLREGKRQIYGSQVRRNAAGDWEPLPLEDEEHVDERRAKVGLGPLAKYLQGFADRGGGKVADRKGERAAPNAPPVAHGFFSSTDTAADAAEKLALASTALGSRGVDFQHACRDFLARFPNSVCYGDVRVLAARCAWSLSEAERAQLGGWDPMAGADDTKLTADQRAEIALTAALRRADAAASADKRDPSEARFDALVGLGPTHRATAAAREALTNAAFEVGPARAARVLRELYPHDPEIAPALAQLEAIGLPFELEFKAVDGRAINLREYRGRVVVLGFWTRMDQSGGASVISTLKDIAQRHGSENFSLVGVNMNADAAVGREINEQFGAEIPFYSDGRGWNNPLAQRFHVAMAPCYFVIDRAGVLRHRGIGPYGPHAIQRIEALLAEKR